MFRDQSAEQIWAIEALLRMPQDVFASVRDIYYGMKRQFSDFDSFVAIFIAANESE